MKHHLPTCDLYESIGRTHIPIPISEVRDMATRIGRASVKGGKVKPAPSGSAIARKARMLKQHRAVKRLRSNASKAKGGA